MQWKLKCFCLNYYQIKRFFDKLKYNSFICIVTYSNQLEVAPLKNILFLAVLKLDVKDSFGYNKENERIGKTFSTI